jgi:tyrosine-protein kinase Etk/Wzc
MQEPQNNNESNQFNFKELFYLYLSKWPWFVLSIAVFLIGAFVYLRYTIPTYTATATLLVKDDKKGGLVSEFASLGGEMDMLGNVKNTVDNEIQVLKSRTISTTAVDSLNLHIKYIAEGRIKEQDLYTNSPIVIVFEDNRILEHSLQVTIDYKKGNTYALYDSEGNKVGDFEFGEKIKNRKGNFTIIHKGNSKAGFKIIVRVTPLEKAVQSFRGRLGVSLVEKNASVVALTVTDPVKERAKDYLDAVIKTYNDDAKADKSQIFRNTAKFLTESIDDISGELGGVEKIAEKYRIQHGVTDIPSQAGLYLENASEFQKELIETETQLRVVAYLKGEVVSAGPSKLIPSGILSTNTQDANSAPSLIEQYNLLVMKRNDALPYSGPKNETIKDYDNQLASLKQNIISSLDRLKKQP